MNNFLTAGAPPGFRAYHFGILIARFLESVLPIPLLRVALWPAVAVSASRRAFSFRKHDWKSPKLPEALRCKGWNFLFLWRMCQGFYFRQILTCFPDRLFEPRWQARLQWEGSDEVLALVRDKRPLVLVTLHYGSIDLLRAFLISRGIDANMVVLGDSRNTVLHRIKDSFLKRRRPSRPVPRVLIAKNAVQNLRHLFEGCALLIAVDSKSDSPLNVPAPNGSLTLAVGAIQMARLAKAKLVPCILQEEKSWRFVIHFGSPVPLDDTDGGLSNMDDASPASELVRFFWPIVSRDPGQYDCGVLSFWKSFGSVSPPSNFSKCAAAVQPALLPRGTEMNYPIFRNIPHLITEQAASKAAAVALEDEGRKLTFAELGQLTVWLVADLRRWGVRRSDRVAVVIPNGLEMSIALLGVCSAATAAPLNPVYREHEFCDYFREMRVSHLVIPRGVATAARAAALKLGISVLELLPGAKAIVPEKSESVMREGEPPEIDSPDAQDVALILLTSGSTGRSKKVPLTHRNICVSVADVARTLELTPEDRCLCMWEQFHIGGLVDLLLVPLASGGTVICTGGFDAAKFYRLLETARPTWYQGVPATVHELLAYARGHGIASGRSSLRLVRVTASALSPQLMDDLEKFFGVPVITTFGMTEAAPLITTNLLPPKVRKAGSTGPSCGPEVAVMDEDGRLLAVGEIGEVVVRGENVFSGYEDAPEANARSFRNGWFCTGDTGYLDEDGYLFLKGRIKETINRGGEKIVPQEIDDVLLTHPGIAEAVAFHIPHKVLGEDVAAAIVPRNPGTLTEEEVRDFVAARLADFKVPRKIVFVEGFERNASGKVNRSLLAGTVGLSGPSDYREPVTEMEKLLAEVWKKELGVSRVGATDTFAGLGGDSLSTLRMVFELEKRLGRRLSAEVLGMISLGANSLEKIASFLQANSTQEQRLPEQVTTAAATVPSAMREELSIDDVRSMVVVMSSGSIPTHRPGSPVKSLNLGGSKPPLFWVFNSPEEEMKALGAALGPDQPIYGFYSGSNTVDREKLSAVAEYYLREIHYIAPEGALVLGGNCRGGRVAIRLAKRLHEVGRQVSHLCILEMFERSLYDFGGNLQMMFGKQSSEFRYRDFHWGKAGWERPFKRPPRIKWVQGKHASYFTPQNVGVLSATVSSFLADEVDNASLADGVRDRLLRGIHRVPPLFDVYVRRTTRA